MRTLTAQRPDLVGVAFVRQQTFGGVVADIQAANDPVFKIRHEGDAIGLRFDFSRRVSAPGVAFLNQHAGRRAGGIRLRKAHLELLVAEALLFGCRVVLKGWTQVFKPIGRGNIDDRLVKIVGRQSMPVAQ